MKKNTTWSRRLIFSGIMLIFVFALDMNAPLGIALGVLYVFCIVLVFHETKKTILLFAAISTLLILFKLIYFYEPSVQTFVFYNRMLSILAIWATTWVCVNNKRQQLRRIRDKERYIASLEKILFLTSHKLRKPIATNMGLINMMIDCNMCQSLTQEDVRQICCSIKDSSSELDDYSREIISFIDEHNLDQKKGGLAERSTYKATF